jgi:DNA-binding XRE family transcriptional regulator
VGAKFEDPFVDEHHATQVAEQTAGCRGTFGRNFRQARITKGFTPQHVCARIGVKEDILDAIEDGRFDPPLDTMEALARSVGRQVWTLLLP